MTLGALLFVTADTVPAFRTFTPNLQHVIWTFAVMAQERPANGRERLVRSRVSTYP
ncbi:MAG TPA: hypothetical protein VFQ74_01455 [Pseudolysinimonas sp.]|nr:hypothetical protein [Pseudolysinimonas sp.]